MTAQIIDGKMISAEVNRENAEKVAFLKSKNITPGLAVILVGDNPASQVYVRAKVKKCEELGIRSFHHVLDKDASMDELLAHHIYEIEIVLRRIIQIKTFLSSHIDIRVRCLKYSHAVL